MPQPAKIFDRSAIPSVWRVPPEMLRLEGLRREVLFALMVFWQYIGCKPGRLLLDVIEYRRATGASERSVGRCIKSLESAGRIRVLRREPRLVEMFIFDWRQPRGAGHLAAPDDREAQLALPFADDPGDEPASPAILQFKKPARRSSVGTGEPPKAG